MKAKPECFPRAAKDRAPEAGLTAEERSGYPLVMRSLRAFRDAG